MRNLFIRITGVILLLFCSNSTFSLPGAMSSFTPTSVAAGTTVTYVNSTSGDDATGDGTVAKPYKSFYKGYSMVYTGDILDLTGTFTWTDAAETGDVATNGYVIDKDITIQGQTDGLTIIQAATAAKTADRRIFTITSSYIVNFKNLTLRNGYIPTSGGSGGAIYIGSITTDVTIEKCILESNHVTYSTSYSFASGGGAIAYVSSQTNNPKLIIEGCVIRNNSATNCWGGGIYHCGSTGNSFVVIRNSTLNNNSSPNAYGTAIGMYYGNLEITNSTISGNSNGFATITLSNHSSGTARLTNVTIANNSSTNATVDFDGVANTYLKNTIIAQNQGGNYGRTNQGSLTNNGNNIVENYVGSDFTNGVNGCFTGTIGCLGLSATLDLNGSSSVAPTLALLSNSLAINGGSTGANGTVTVPTTDQRGVARVGNPDIGAYEFTGTQTSPSVNVSSTTLTGFSYYYGNGPGIEKSFTISGTNLVGNLLLTAPTSYQMSTTTTGTYGSSLTYIPTGGTVSETTVYVKLKSSLAVGSYNDQNIAITSSCISTNVKCSGSVLASILPTISSFSPAAAAPGATITITGTYFTGTTAVSFGGIAATSFNVVSATSITAVVGTGASGSVSVTNAAGTGTRSGFTFTPPIVSTNAISIFSNYSATMGGNITSAGGSSVTERGVVYSSTDQTPTIGETDVLKDINGTGTGTYGESVGSLIYGTTYYVQAYAINSYGTSYGGVQSFTTISRIPVVYVNSSTGNDATGDGSEGNPYKSFTKGYGMVYPGDILDLTGTFTWTDAAETGDVVTNGYVIDKDITIQGQANASTIIQAATAAKTADRRIFTITSSYTVNFKNLTLRNGYIPTSGGSGGAIYIGSITTNVTIEKCILESNHVIYNGSPYSFSTGGGAIAYANSQTNNPKLIIEGCVIRNNSATNCWGGGIFQAGYQKDNIIIISNSTINNNSSSSAWGTAIGSWGGNMEIINTTISGNSNGYSTVMFSNGGYGTVRITNVTIANNSAWYPSLYLEGVTNTYIKNTFIAQNQNTSSTYGTSNFMRTNQGSLTNNGNNIVENYAGSDFTNGINGCFTGTIGCLGLSTTLDLNGSSSIAPTLALLSNSLAINGGSTGANGTVTVPDTDQRGIARVGNPDIGAYEFTGTQTSPSVNVSSTTLTDFSYYYGNGPGAEKSFTISGTNLVGNLLLTAPTSYQIAATAAGTYGSTLTYTPASGTVSETTVYVKLKSPLAVGSYNDQNIAITSSCLSTNVKCSGSVLASILPTISAFTPAVATTGTTVTITGTNFNGTTAVTFGGTAASSFSVVSATSITAVVAAGTSGSVNVTNPAGTATMAGFTFVAPFTISTTTVTSFNNNSATMGGVVTTAVSASVTERGVVYSSTDQTPTIGETGIIKDANGSGTGSFSKSITSLVQSTPYYVRAYAINAIGTTYGGIVSFTTSDKPSATVTLGNLTVVYSGSGQAATATTTPSGLQVDFTYNGSAILPVNAGTYTVMGTVNSNDYSGTATGSMVISKATATISFASLTQTYDGSQKSASATTTPSGLNVPITYDSAQRVNAGSYPLTATISDNNYQGTATGTLVISKATATVTLENLTTVIYDGNPHGVTATTTPAGMTVTITYNGSSTVPSAANTYVVIGTISNSNYQGTATGNFIITKSSQTITFSTIPSGLRMTEEQTLVATASSGLAVSFESSDPAIASISGNTMSVKGTGTVIITAKQEGNNYFNSAADVSQTVQFLPSFDNSNALFTPNNDGVNDYWIIPKIDELGTVKVKIYSRNGALVYESTNYTNNWDGTWKNMPLPAGSYYYIIDSSEKGSLKGVVNIIR